MGVAAVRRTLIDWAAHHSNVLIAFAVGMAAHAFYLDAFGWAGLALSAPQAFAVSYLADLLDRWQAA